MKVIFSIAGLHPESGGPARSVPTLAVALADAGVKPEIVSLDYGPRTAAPLAPPSEKVKTTFVQCDSWIAHRLQYAPQFKQTLAARARDGQAQIIHDTGLWLATNHAAAQVATRLKLPRIVSPRGMLAGWALQHKGLKKRLAWMLYQGADLQAAKLLHATSVAEAEDFRRADLRQPIAVIPNGVELPVTRRMLPSAATSRVRTILFIGRVHPVKGLGELVQAWAAVRAPGWKIVIAGGDELGHRAEVEAAAHTAGVGDDFEFVGEVSDATKCNWLARADLFVLPSRSENFGMAVAEALAAGIPVITTRGTPWSGLLENRCGWWLETEVEVLAAALREAVAMDDRARFEMGGRGRAWMEQDFSWAGVATRMRTVYEWMLSGGPKPDFVFSQ